MQFRVEIDFENTSDNLEWLASDLKSLGEEHFIDSFAIIQVSDDEWQVNALVVLTGTVTEVAGALADFVSDWGKPEAIRVIQNEEPSEKESPQQPPEVDWTKWQNPNPTTPWDRPQPQWVPGNDYRLGKFTVRTPTGWGIGTDDPEEATKILMDMLGHNDDNS